VTSRPDAGAISLPDPPAHVHLVGIGGIGVSGLARMLAGLGYSVSGSDLAASPLIEELLTEGIPVFIGHDAANIGGADLVVVTAATSPSNPELQAAGAMGVPVVKRAALLGLLTRSRTCLAVAGSHGKSTTSGMAAVALDVAGLAPSFAVGAVVPLFGTNARLAIGRQIVVEADEYDYSFLWLQPDVAVVTNIEHDHPDIFPGREDVLAAFARFVEGIKPGGTLVLASDDPGCSDLLSRIDRGGVRVVTFGEQQADWRLVSSEPGRAVVQGSSGQVFELRLQVPGRHNLRNALAVLAAAEPLGIDPMVLVPGLEAFTGVGRRFEVLQTGADLTIISDYAHHPTEIAATLAAARERFAGQRLVAVFQPHTYSRTKALAEQFAAALDQADLTILADVYPARETDTLGVSSRTIASMMTTEPAMATSPEEAALVTRGLVTTGDVLLVMGAGDIHRTAEILAGR
jgi:UDP-N-acetylmuramate--alanine ligase